MKPAAEEALGRLGLAETLHEGARITASMAAAAVEELLGVGAQERFTQC